MAKGKHVGFLLVLLGLPMLASEACADDAVAAVPAGDYVMYGPGPQVGRLSWSAENDWCQPLWSAKAEALFLHRSTTRNQPLLFDGASDELLDASDLDFGYEAGERLGLTYHGRGGCEVALSYFAVDGWDSIAEASAGATPHGLVVGPGVVFPAADVRFQYRSRLYNTELNLRRPINEWLTPLVGFRWIELSDQYQARGTEFTEGSPFIYEIKTRNHLYGFQMGAEAQLFRRCRFRLEGIADAGIYYTNADQRSRLDNPGFVSISAADGGSRTSFVAEIGLTGVYQLNKHFALRGGYEVMWIEGVALAPQQIPVAGLYTPIPGIDENGGVLYHGANVGLELKW